MLTIFTIVITIPAAISGIYGMNLALPLEENRWAFLYVLLLIAGLWGAFFFFLKRKEII